MQHRHSRLRLNQKPDHAQLLKRNLVTSLVLYESIRTTRKRAKVIQPMIDRLISSAKKTGGHNAVRSLNAVVTDKNATRKILEVLVQRYATRASGFTTIKAVGARKGDGAELVDLTLMDREEVKTVVKEPKAKKPAKVNAEKKTDASTPAA